MKPNEPARSLVTSNVVDSVDFAIDDESAIHIMTILRGSLYSDKPLAVLREYSANAWDAHRMIGKGELPIQVTLPTLMDPTLRIRDWGPGLSHEQMFKVYTRFGKSTKRDDDNSVGWLGIGCKSGHAYTDTFTVTSWHEGKKRVYVATINEDNGSSMKLMHEEDLGTLWETGIEVSVGVREEDVDEFHEKAYDLFQHFVPRPTINCELPAPPAERLALKHGTIDYVNDVDENGTWMAVMGCIPYRLRLDQLDANAFGELWPCIKKLAGTLTFDIGALQINPSREGLNYTKKTKAAIVQKFTDLIDEYVAQTLEAVEEDDKLTDFDKRTRLVVLRTLDLPLPKEWEEWAKLNIKLFGDGDTYPFYMLKDGHVAHQVTISNSLKFFVDDVGKELRGYKGLDGLNHYVFRSKDGLEAEELRTQVLELLDHCQLGGAKVELISTLTWEEPEDTRKKRERQERRTTSNAASTAKRRASMFVLRRHGDLKGFTPSTQWDITVRVPTNDDVFVVMEKYVPQGATWIERKAFFVEYDRTAKIAQAFGRPMPTIYGYKHTETKPVNWKKLSGCTWTVWREAFLKELANSDDAYAVLRAWHWKQKLSFSQITEHQLADIADDIGADHELVQFLTEAQEVLSKHRAELCGNKGAVDVLLPLNDRKLDDPMWKLSRITTKYPLLHQLGVGYLIEKGYHYGDAGKVEPKALREYVKLVDYKIANNLDL